LQRNSQLEAHIAAQQYQLANMAVLLQYCQSNGVQSYTDTALAYGTSSCILHSPPILPPRILTQHRRKCAEQVQRSSFDSIAHIRGNNRRRIRPTIQPLRHADAGARPHVTSSRASPSGVSSIASMSFTHSVLDPVHQQPLTGNTN
jgi:hypothetical protein